MNQIVCDGCLSVLDRGVLALSGKRANNMGGGGLPHGKFHLCDTCAVVGFHAIALNTKNLSHTQRTKLAGEINDAMRAKRIGGAS